jgi:hypothetical protein
LVTAALELLVVRDCRQPLPLRRLVIGDAEVVQRRRPRKSLVSSEDFFGGRPAFAISRRRRISPAFFSARTRISQARRSASVFVACRAYSSSRSASSRRRSPNRRRAAPRLSPPDNAALG